MKSEALEYGKKLARELNIDFMDSSAQDTFQKYWG